MPAVTDIGTLLDCDPKIRHGRPKIAGTGITVHRIAIYYRMGFPVEEIDAEIAVEEAEEEAIFAQNRCIPEPNR